MAEEKGSFQNAALFISYSRKDKEFARRLNDSLDASGFVAWADWEGIPPSSDWREDIRQAIESAPALIFIISPDSVSSKECGFELETALNYSKKIIPIMHRPPPKGAELHPKLKAVNWIYMRKGDDYDAGVAQVIESLKTDLEWTRQQTRLLLRANEWDSKKRNSSFLLRGTDLVEAEQWQTEASGNEDREILPVQAEYIRASRQAHVRGQRRLLGGVTFALVVSIALGVYAIFQRNIALDNEIQAESSAATAVSEGNARATQQVIAEQNAELARTSENLALAQRSAAQAQLLQGQPGELDTSTLLALASWQRDPSEQAESILRRNLSMTPLPLAEMQQGGEIVWIRFSDDGQAFVTASENGTFCIWEMPDGRKRFCESHEDDVYSALFIRDGALLVTSSADKSVRIWNALDGTQTERFDFDSSVASIAVSPDEVWMAVGTEGTGIAIINLNSMRRVQDLDIRGTIYGLDFSPNSAWLAIGSTTGNVQMWRVMTDIWLSGPVHQGRVFAVAFSPDGRWLASIGDDNTARLALTATGTTYYTLPHDNWVEAVSFSPDSRWLATASDDNRVRVWDLSTGNETLRLRHEDYTQDVSFSADGRLIASTSYDRTVRVWDARTGAELFEVPLRSYGTALAISPNCAHLVYGDSLGRVALYDISSLAALAGDRQFPEDVRKVLFSRDGDWLVTNADSRKVWLIPVDVLQTGEGASVQSPLFHTEELTYDLAISPDSRWVAAAESDLRQAKVYDRVGQGLTTFEHDDEVNAIDFSADSQRLAVGGQSGTVDIWDLATRTKAATFSIDTSVLTLSYHPTQNWLAVGGVGQVVIYDLANERTITTIYQAGEIRMAAFSPDGSWLLTASSTGGVQFFRVTNETIEFAEIMLPSEEIISIAYHPTLPWAAMGGQSGEAFLVDLSTLSEIARIRHAAAVTGVSFSADGKLLATASRKSLQLWDVARILLIPRTDIDTITCARMTGNLNQEEWAAFFYEEPYYTLCPDLPERER